MTEDPDADAISDLDADEDEDADPADVEAIEAIARRIEQGATR